MVEGRGYNPEEAKNKPPKNGLLDKFKKGLATVGFLVAADRAVMQDAPKNQVAVTSAERSSGVAKPLLLNSKPDWKEESSEDETMDSGSEPQENFEADEVEVQKLEPVERAQHIIELIRKRYKDMFAVECYSDGVCQVSIKNEKGLPGATAEALHVFDFRFDELGNCYVKEIIDGEKSVIGEVDGTTVKLEGGGTEIMIGAERDQSVQDDNFLSEITENWPLPPDKEQIDDETRDRVFSEIEKCFSEGKTVEETIKWLIENENGIVKEESSAIDLLFGLYMEYGKEEREHLTNYYQKLQNFFTQEDKS